MEYRLLGSTGVEVSALSLGTMLFGTATDEEESARIFARSRDAGINLFDCANVYGGGRAEEVLSKLIAPCREEIVLTSKVASSTGQGRNQRGASRLHIVTQVEQSLRRLKTDRIDIYFIHHFDATTPIEETLSALDQLVQSGKILYPAVSNWAAWQVARGLGIADCRGFDRIACMQPMYNLVKRQAEVEILPLAAAEGLGVIVYSPLGGGLLTGKYVENEASQGRLVENPMYAVRFGEEHVREIAARFTRYARERGDEPATLAVAWAAAHPAISSVLIGARNMAQLETSLAAADVVMTREWRDEISALSYTPPLANDRNEERA